MEPRIEILKEKKLVGKRLKMSISQDRTAELWSSFGPSIKSITNKLGTDKISMQIYSPSFFNAYNPKMEFEKWATVEVENFDNLLPKMEIYTLRGGQYAVFVYKGSSKDSSFIEYIFRTWLPTSGYQLDNRPHFEILGEKYKKQRLLFRGRDMDSN